jgi:drug/metabolite transporter (DMT)-like permease
MLFYTYPVMVALLGVVTGHDRLSPAKLVALLSATTGVVLVLLGGIEVAGKAIDPVGVLFGLGAAVSQTVFIAVSRAGHRSIRSDAATLAILAGSAVLGAGTALVAGQLPELLGPLGSLQSWPFILVAGIIGAGFPTLLFLGSIRRIGGTRTGILMLWEPVMGALLAAAFLAEPLGPIQVLGGALVLVAAAILQLSGHRTRAPSEAPAGDPAADHRPPTATIA